MRFDAPLFSGVWCIQPRGDSRARLVPRPFAIVHGPGTLQDICVQTSPISFVATGHTVSYFLISEVFTRVYVQYLC